MFFFKKITNIGFQLLIGLIKLKTNAKMETTVCLLCLPEQFKSYYEENCTVVGYGRPSKAALNQFGRGIVMFLSIHNHTFFLDCCPNITCLFLDLIFFCFCLSVAAALNVALAWQLS